MSLYQSGPFVPSDVADDVSASDPVAAPLRHIARYLRVRDDTFEVRETFVRAVFGEPACFAYADDGTHALSRAQADYDILILDVTDPARKGRFLRAHRALLRQVAKFAIMHDSSPQRRARMLSAGCDDVFDVARMSPQEALLRVSAVMRRRDHRHAAWLDDRRAAADVAHLADPEGLTPRERALLAVLARQQGEAISVQRLCQLIAPPDAARFRRSLKVSISKLRRKLFKPWRIESAPGGGYGLYGTDLPDTIGIAS